MIDAAALAIDALYCRLLDLNFTCAFADLAGGMVTQQVKGVFASTFAKSARYPLYSKCCPAHNPIPP
jgi:hypothetical protein